MIKFIIAISGLLLSCWPIIMVTTTINLANDQAKFDLNKSHVFNVFKKMAIPSNRKLSHQYNLSDILDASEQDRNQCYTPELKSSPFKVDIFQDSLADIVHRYFLAFPKFLNYGDLNSSINEQDQIVHRTGHLLEALGKLVKLVGECLKTDPKKRNKYGLNVLSAMSRKEFASRLIDFESFKHQKRKVNDTRKGWIEWPFECDHRGDASSLPPTYDARELNLVTSVKDQGACGSCVVFSAMGQIEAAYSKQFMKLRDFSAQEWVNCWGMGCAGGSFTLLYDKILVDGGLTFEKNIPYTGVAGECYHNYQVRLLQGYCAKADDYTDEQIRLMLIRYGTLGVCISTSSEGLGAYSEGVFHGPCEGQIDHAVLLVGYTEDAWIVKNSWSTGWGDNGYIKISREGNLCGMKLSATAAWF